MLHKNFFLPLIAIFFLILVFVTYKDLFQSYFEADEWFHFTHYLPLIKQPDGFWQTIVSTIVDTNPLSRGQHIVPIGEEIFFFNTKFFGINFTPYVFMSLLLHAINSFLVFFFVKLFVRNKAHSVSKLFIPFLSGVFFALSVIPIHAFTWAAFYGQNVLSVTFFLLCVIFFKIAFITSQKKFLYVSIVFLLLDLLTKETATILFFLLPFMAFIGKRIFSFKFLTKLYLLSLVVFISFRFILPQVGLGFDHLINTMVDREIASAYKNSPQVSLDTQTIVSTDLSIHENIVEELAFRSVTFPLKMVSELYFPRQTIFSFMQVLTPIIYPTPTSNVELLRSQNGQFFIYGPGNDFLIYLLSIGILLIIFFLIRNNYRKNEIENARLIGIGLAIIVFGTLPLVMIVLSFPRWGYDTYFDSRHYYMPTVGAAILFPFLLITLSESLSHLFKMLLRVRIHAFIFTGVLFLLWFINNMMVVQENLKTIVQVTGSPRRQIIDQLKQQLPVLPQKVVFHVETDGSGAYGPVLPFQTSIPQVLSVVYYRGNPLPDSFYNTFILDAKAEGYQEGAGRGFGYYASKKTLADALIAKKFDINDVYSFYYDNTKTKVTNRTEAVREEMKKYLVERKDLSDWQIFESSPSATEKLSFLYPPETEIIDEPVATTEAKVLKEIALGHPQFSAVIKVLRVSPTLDLIETTEIVEKVDSNEAPLSKKVSLDSYHTNDVIKVNTEEPHYFMKFDDLLIIMITPSIEEESLFILEKILGSVSLEEQVIK